MFQKTKVLFQKSILRINTFEEAIILTQGMKVSVKIISHSLPWFLNSKVHSEINLHIYHKWNKFHNSTILMILSKKTNRLSPSKDIIEVATPIKTKEPPWVSDLKITTQRRRCSSRIILSNHPSEESEIKYQEAEFEN